MLYKSAARLLFSEEGLDASAARSPIVAPTPQGPSRSLSVLVVDDGAVNRKVATQMLVSLHHRVDIAEDGAMALAMLERKLYDLIFMDCRMPGLSGLETTRRIRAGDSLNRQTPIIALTANAFPEDREQCFAAGMNDFLAKPVVLEDLQRAVDRSIWSVGRLGNGDEVKTESVTAPAIDISTLTMLKKLEPSEDASAFLDDLIETFLRETPEVIEHLIKEIELGQSEAIEHYAHKLKGYARNLGAQQLAELAGNVENQAGAAWDSGIVGQKLHEAFSAATAELSHWHSRNLKFVVCQ
jgi:CheY-like chemotaxis protein